MDFGVRERGGRIESVAEGARWGSRVMIASIYLVRGLVEEETAKCHYKWRH